MSLPESTEGNAKCWCFTKHYGEAGQSSREEALAILTAVAGSEACNYLLAGDEVAPETGTRHFQGYVQFEKKIRFTALKRLMPSTHLTVAHGDDQQNYDYCTKGGSFTEFGERRDTTGGRAGREAEQDRWKRARLAAVQNKLDDVPDEIFVKCYSNIRAIAKDHLSVPPDADGVTGVWIWGPPGIGKSRRARAEYPDAYKKLANKWWDSYNGEKFVILDDFGREHECLGYHLKIWADRYGFIGETKGGALAARPEKLVVTSNYSPDEIFKDSEMLDAIRRRFTVIHMGTLPGTGAGLEPAVAGSTPSFNAPPATSSSVIDLTDVNE